MRETLQQLLTTLQAAQPVAYCRLVETRGSTPQKAGALMLVYPNGQQAGTLGGGCVEAEVKRRAIALLGENRSEICSFQLDSDYGWDDGLICGGRMQILIQPTSGSGPVQEYLLRLAHLAAAGEGLTEAVLLPTEKPSSAQTTSLVAPTTFLFSHAGEHLASLPTNMDSYDLLDAAKTNLRPLVTRPRAYVAAGMAYLPLLRRCRLVIVGGGHVGKAVADLATELDFDVWIIDDRDEYVSSERFPLAQQRIAGPIETTLPTLSINSDTYCLIVTRGHHHDEEALFHLVDRGARYVGLIGSRRKIKMIFDDLLEKGISGDALRRVYAPLGIEIGSQSVMEIAVSICAELVAHRNLGGEVPGRPRSVEV